MRQNGTLSYLLSDHLGSTSVVTSATGAVTARRLYTPWGGDRGTPVSLPTTFGYTGQREEAELGLSFYNARWYDPALGRFIQADTIVPDQGNPLAWDRYSYTYNNPLRFTDPSGHRVIQDGPQSNHSPSAPPSGPSALDNSDTNNEDNNLITYFDVNLTQAEVQDLISELDFWINQAGGSLDDLGKLGEFGGTFAELLAALGIEAPTLGPAGAVLFLGGVALDYTTDDLVALRQEIAMASEGGTKEISLSLGTNVGNWNVAVNNDVVVEHLSGLPPLLAPKGTLNGTPAWVLMWYLFDYQRGPFTPPVP